MNSVIDWLRNYLTEAWNAIRAEFHLEGFWQAVLVFLEYAWPLFVALFALWVLGVSIRRKLRQRGRRRQLQQLQRRQQALVGETYAEDRRKQIHAIAEELAASPANPQPVVLPGGKREIAREGLGGLANRLFDLLLEEANDLGGNEVHLFRTPTATHVRYRISALLQDQHDLPRHLYPVLHNVAKGRTGLELGEENRNENAFFLQPVGAENRRVNVMIYAGTNEPSLVLRLAPPVWPDTRFIDLGMTKAQVQEYGDLLLSPHGLLLLVGPRHSGKTSLGYTSLAQFHPGPRKAYALEDRPLTELPGIRQYPLIHLTGNARVDRLKRVIVESPDVLYLDCTMPDYLARESIESMIRDDLVIQTVATTRTAAYLQLVGASVVDADVLMESLLAVVECRLVRRVCEECAAEAKPTKAEARLFAETIQKDDHYRRGAGCSRCLMTGYKGVMGLYAILHPDDSLRQLTRNEISAGEFARRWNERTRRAIERNGVVLARQGVTTLEEIVRILSPADLE